MRQPPHVYRRRRLVAVAAVAAVGRVCLRGRQRADRAVTTPPRRRRLLPLRRPRSCPAAAGVSSRSGGSSPPTARHSDPKSSGRSDVGTLSSGRSHGYRPPGRPLRQEDAPRCCPRLELIAVLATASPGDDGMHRERQSARHRSTATCTRRAETSAAVLDVQPGRASFMLEVTCCALAAQPDVSLALDPEWRVGPGRSRRRWSARSSEVNGVSRLARRIVRPRTPGEAPADPSVHRLDDPRQAGRRASAACDHYQRRRLRRPARTRSPSTRS